MEKKRERFHVVVVLLQQATKKRESSLGLQNVFFIVILALLLPSILSKLACQLYTPTPPLLESVFILWIVRPSVYSNTFVFGYQLKSVSIY